MEGKLLAYLKSNQTRILDDWHNRYVRQAVRTGMTAVDAYLQPIEGFFSDILTLFNDDHIEKFGTSATFEHFSLTKHRLKLPHLVEVFVCGEEAISKALMSEQKNLFAEEIEEALTTISRIFKRLTQYHVDRFCTDCIHPLQPVYDIGQHLAEVTMAARTNKQAIDD